MSLSKRILFGNDPADDAARALLHAQARQVVELQAAELEAGTVARYDALANLDNIRKVMRVRIFARERIAKARLRKPSSRRAIWRASWSGCLLPSARESPSAVRRVRRL
jgi:hypothetical protein